MDEAVLRDLQTAFGIKILAAESVSGGWLNEKWRVTTDAGEILVKRYSHERYSRKKLEKIEQALARQRILFDEGIPCPRIWQAGEAIIRRPSEEIDYMVMDFLPGSSVGPETVNLSQMESLGVACARMHEAFRRLPAEGVEGWPLNREGISETLMRHVERSGEERSSGAPQACLEALSAAKAWAERTDFSFVNRLETSIAHEDFTPDNMLFSQYGCSAILDFDRNRYSFPLHDVGRILLSLSLNGDRIDAERVRAFQRGYGNLKDEDIYNAFMLTALIEIPWWIQPDTFTDGSRKVRRFVDEMLFLMNKDFRF